MLYPNAKGVSETTETRVNLTQNIAMSLMCVERKWWK